VTPLSAVVANAGAYKGTGGVIEKVNTDAAGKVVSVVVDMDADHKRVTFKPAELTVIKAH
jgi:transcription elongation factor